MGGGPLPGNRARRPAASAGPRTHRVAWQARTRVRRSRIFGIHKRRAVVDAASAPATLACGNCVRRRRGAIPRDAPNSNWLASHVGKDAAGRHARRRRSRRNWRPHPRAPTPTTRQLSALHKEDRIALLASGRAGPSGGSCRHDDPHYLGGDSSPAYGRPGQGPPSDGAPTAPHADEPAGKAAHYCGFVRARAVAAVSAVVRRGERRGASGRAVIVVVVVVVARARRRVHQRADGWPIRLVGTWEGARLKAIGDAAGGGVCGDDDTTSDPSTTSSAGISSRAARASRGRRALAALLPRAEATARGPCPLPGCDVGSIIRANHNQ